MDTIVALFRLLQGDESITYSPFSSDISFFLQPSVVFQKKKKKKKTAIFSLSCPLLICCLDQSTK
jgi:hypothetical protein